MHVCFWGHLKNNYRLVSSDCLRAEICTYDAHTAGAQALSDVCKAACTADKRVVQQMLSDGVSTLARHRLERR